MQDSLHTNPEKEIDLRELFMIAWAYKVFITVFCIIGTLSGAYYALNADKEFTSTASFVLNLQNTNKNLANLSSLYNFASLGSSKSQLPTAKTNGRIFIEKIDKKANFSTDPYFNSYDPNFVDPNWKALIKRAVGWEKPSTDAQEAIWQAIIKSYTQSVIISEDKDQTISITVTHENAKRAAEIANIVMDEIITNTKETSDNQQKKQLSYLSNTLANALGDLELTQSNLKEFSLRNSALPIESFAAEALRLETLRMQSKQTDKLHEAVTGLSQMLTTKTTNQDDYLLLRDKFPIIDQVEFRRLLGQNELLNSWIWPELNSVNIVLDTLSDRKLMLKRQINASQEKAERSGQNIESYSKLQRDAKQAEASYTVMIEQVKAQSVLAGYQPDKSEIYEYAYPSRYPNKPNRKLILILGAALGIFLGTTLAFIFAISRGVYYTKTSLSNDVQSKITLSSRTLNSLRNKSLIKMGNQLSKKPRSVLRDIAVEINKSEAKQVVITTLNTKLKADDTAKALAITMQSDSIKTAIINFSKRNNEQIIDGEQKSVGSFIISSSKGNVSILTPGDNLGAMDLISNKDFLKNIQHLNTKFDLIFLCADNNDTISLLRALEGGEMFHLTVARTRHSKSSSILHMRSLLPIQGLLHD